MFVFRHFEHESEVFQLLVELALRKAFDQMATFASQAHRMTLTISHLRFRRTRIPLVKDNKNESGLTLGETETTYMHECACALIAIWVIANHPIVVISANGFPNRQR